LINDFHRICYGSHDQIVGLSGIYLIPMNADLSQQLLIRLASHEHRCLLDTFYFKHAGINAH
jgi:hypothetical protein